MNNTLSPEQIKRMEDLAHTMPTWDDFVIEEYRKDPEWALYRIISEYEEYLQTGEVQYLLSVLNDVKLARADTCA